MVSRPTTAPVLGVATPPVPPARTAHAPVAGDVSGPAVTAPATAAGAPVSTAPAAAGSAAAGPGAPSPAAR